MFTKKSSKNSENWLFECVVGKWTRLHREVLALSHRKQFEDFSQKNRRIVNTKNWLASSLVRFSHGSTQTYRVLVLCITTENIFSLLLFLRHLSCIKFSILRLHEGFK